MANRENNKKVISECRPHTVLKFKLIESYVIRWAQILLNNKECNYLVFIDPMCNSGIYLDSENEDNVYGTSIRVAKY